MTHSAKSESTRTTSDLRQTTVFITGASRGIGLALAQEYAECHWNVVATCREPDAAEALQALSRDQAHVQVLRLDVSDESQIERLPDTLGNHPIDVLINNAGWARKGPALKDVTYHGWEQAMRVNAYAPLKLAQVLTPHLAQSARKTFITVSSQMGSITQNLEGTRYAYRASKSAANMVTRTLHSELASLGIIVTSLHPGWVRTGLGGPAAPQSPAECAATMRRLIDSLTLEQSGQFLDPQGKVLPW